MSWGDWGLDYEPWEITAAQPWPNNKINPDPTDPYSEHFNPDRPRLNQYPDDYQYADQPPLPHPDEPDQQFTEMSRWPRSQEKNTLWRGMRLDLDHPNFANHPDVQGMKKILYGEHPDDGLFGVPQGQGNLKPHPDSPEGQQLSKHLLDFMEDTGQRQNQYRTNDETDNFTKIHDTANPTWLGRHWTTDPEIAEDFAHPAHQGKQPKGRSLSVLMGADWDGRGEDLSRSNSGGSWGDEKEINLSPGTQMHVHTLGIRHPPKDPMDATWQGHDDWHNLLSAPQMRTAGAPMLDSINPTGGLYVDYRPEDRTGEHGPGITTLDKVTGNHPDAPVTIYRGAPRHQTRINPGDFITTNSQLAQDYAGDGHVLRAQVPHKHVATDPDEWEGEEHIYSPR